MDAALFANMLSDKSLTDLKKLAYKYKQADIKEFVSLLENGFYETVPLYDFDGNDLVYIKGVAQGTYEAAKTLLRPQLSGFGYGVLALEEEIIATNTIEQIDYSRDSVRRILSGAAPADENETRILGMKKGFDFIADVSNTINADNLFKLYKISIDDFLPDDCRLLPEEYYRHDSVYRVGDKIEHRGLPAQLLPLYMEKLLLFINARSEIDDLTKAAIIHFYLGYIHPYFDGNGRMARLLHLWYLVQSGYSSALFVPLSDFISKSRKKYYNAFSLCESNAEISGKTDVSPFIKYFKENVYSKVGSFMPAAATVSDFDEILKKDRITEKENALWQFVLVAYGNNEFSTKQLEKDFGDAAYATIYSFVHKFEKLGLLRSVRYGSRVRYRVSA